MIALSCARWPKLVILTSCHFVKTSLTILRQHKWLLSGLRWTTSLYQLLIIFTYYESSLELKEKLCWYNSPTVFDLRFKVVLSGLRYLLGDQLRCANHLGFINTNYRLHPTLLSQKLILHSKEGEFFFTVRSTLRDLSKCAYHRLHLCKKNESRFIWIPLYWSSHPHRSTTPWNSPSPNHRKQMIGKD